MRSPPRTPRAMEGMQGGEDGCVVNVAGPTSFSGLGLGKKLTTAAAARKQRKPQLLGRLNSKPSAVAGPKLGAKAASKQLVGVLRRKT